MGGARQDCHADARQLVRQNIAEPPERGFLQPLAGIGHHRIRAQMRPKFFGCLAHGEGGNAQQHQIGVGRTGEIRGQPHVTRDRDARQQFFVFPVPPDPLDFLFKRGPQGNILPKPGRHHRQSRTPAARATDRDMSHSLLSFSQWSHTGILS